MTLGEARCSSVWSEGCGDTEQVVPGLLSENMFLPEHICVVWRMDLTNERDGMF